MAYLWEAQPLEDQLLFKVARIPKSIANFQGKIPDVQRSTIHGRLGCLTKELLD